MRGFGLLAASTAVMHRFVLTALDARQARQASRVWQSRTDGAAEGEKSRGEWFGSGSDSSKSVKESNTNMHPASFFSSTLCAARCPLPTATAVSPRLVSPNLIPTGPAPHNRASPPALLPIQAQSTPSSHYRSLHCEKGRAKLAAEASPSPWRIRLCPWHNHSVK